jgi:hypothetical protein
LKKKNVFCLPLYSLGIQTGPPSLAPNRIVAVLRAGLAQYVVEEIVSVQIFVAEVLVNAPVIVV